MFKTEYEKLENAKIVPVVALTSEEDALPLSEALLQGGIKAIEVTFRNPNDYGETSRAISAIRKAIPEIMVGAGTVLNRNLAEMAIEAGAEFIVSPGFSKDVVSYCIEKKIVCYPGVATASEIMEALSYNLNVLKLFPLEVLGGISILKSFSGPFPNVQFLPSGGINEKNAFEYYSQKNVLAISGSWMVKKEMLLEKDWEKITMLSKNALQLLEAKNLEAKN